MKTTLQSLMLLLALAPPALAAGAAEPYTPHSDAELVERMPQALGSAAERAQARRLRAALQQAPEQLPLALTLARESLARFRAGGDPRELGQAEAALAPWWRLERPPPAVRLLRATVRQSQHQFAPALADLEALIGLPMAPLPLRAQAELSRAAVLQVIGRWSEAEAGCARLAGPAYAALGAGVQWHGQVCQAELASLQGRPGPAEAELARLARVADQLAAPQGWISLLRAELAERQGEATAEGLFRQALRQQADIYTRAAYADWLLGRQRWAEAAELLLAHRPGAEPDMQAVPDALLLRLSIAWQRGQDRRAGAALADLQARFDAARLRGDDSHGRERARFHLDLRPDAAQALAEARANWAVQKEPADALLLLRAARAAGQPEAAEPVWRFVREQGLRDVRLGSPP